MDERHCFALWESGKQTDSAEYTIFITTMFAHILYFPNHDFCIGTALFSEFLGKIMKLFLMTHYACHSSGLILNLGWYFTLRDTDVADTRRTLCCASQHFCVEGNGHRRDVLC